MDAAEIWILALTAVANVAVAFALSSFVRSVVMSSSRPGQQDTGSRTFREDARGAPEDSSGDPVLVCGDVWEDGHRIGQSSCRRSASVFWLTLDDRELHCKCGSCHSDSWKVPNGRGVDREAAVASVVVSVVVSQVMLD